MDIGINQIIATTWWFIIPFLAILAQIEPDAIDTGDLNRLSFRLEGILALAVGAAGGIASSFFYLPFWSILTFLIIASLVLRYCLRRFEFEHKCIQLGSFVETKTQRLLMLFLIFLVLLLQYRFTGSNHAKRLAEGQIGDRRITIKEAIHNNLNK